MDFSNPIIAAIIAAIVGLLVGLICYRLFSKGERDRASLQQKLLEREHQIAELKKSMRKHITSVSQCLDNIREETYQLESQMEEDATQWGLDKLVAAEPGKDTTPRSDSGDNSFATPRDYADGKSGTLSEDYGLKDRAKPSEATAEQPPRY